MSYTIDSDTLRDLIKTGKTALNGNSNDAEHDALYEIIVTLEMLKPESKRKAKRTSGKTS